MMELAGGVLARPARSRMQIRIRFGWRPRLRGRQTIASVGVLLVCGGFSGGTSSAAAERFVAVAWSDSEQARGVVQRFQSEPPWAFDGDAIVVGGKTTLRVAGNRLYAVSGADGTITAIDGGTQHGIAGIARPIKHQPQPCYVSHHRRRRKPDPRAAEPVAG